MPDLGASPLRFLLLALLALALVACGGIREEDADRLPAAELYEVAKTALKSGNVSRAETFYRRLVSRFPFGEYTEQAQLELAYAQYRLNKPEEALSAVNRFIRTYPTHPHVDYAYFLRGLINFDRNRGVLAELVPEDEPLRDQSYARQAFLDFAELLQRFPQSRYAADARQRMIYLRNTLAQGELAVADYYFRRGAYVAVINRAKTIIETYQQTPQAADALALMIESYTRLGQPELAADARQVLTLNAPDHPYLTGRAAERRSWLKRLWPFGRAEPPALPPTPQPPSV